MAQYLPESSKITAIDKVLQHFPETMGNSINIDFRVGDFENESLPLQHLDGIMMANSLHYVSDKEASSFKQKYFAKNPAFLIIEYNRTEANQWVPYPVPFEQLKTLFSRLDYTHIENRRTKVALWWRDVCMLCKEGS
ncbi:MAG: class I SAM-dependent methyltransferase [Saprospiraceae bacterium]|nr:class I SAM-dependent methyltransferase [Candidatus Parvibacillus calidus]